LNDCTRRRCLIRLKVDVNNLTLWLFAYHRAARLRSYYYADRIKLYYWCAFWRMLAGE